jgi:hypothetical protein
LNRIQNYSIKLMKHKTFLHQAPDPLYHALAGGSTIWRFGHGSNGPFQIAPTSSRSIAFIHSLREKRDRDRQSQRERERETERAREKQRKRRRERVRRKTGTDKDRQTEPGRYRERQRERDRPKEREKERD